MTILTLGMLLGGIVLLIKGADYLVDGASTLAKRYGISSVVIGLTIVAFGTSMPELVVNIVGALQGNSSIAFGNIIGSNLANILLILGITGLITTLKVQKVTVWKEIPFSLLAVLVLLILANRSFLDGVVSTSLTKSGGLILLSFFVIFLYYAHGSIQGSKESSKTSNVTTLTPNRKSGLMILGGMGGLYLGGVWTVNGAVAIAETLGLSDFLISVTVIAIGTSLPELVTSVVAARKDNVDLAVGNIVGSNIFNIFWILGATALLRPLDFPEGASSDLLMLLLATFLLFLFMFVGKKHQLQRRQSYLFLILYVGYIVFVIWRG